MLKKNYSPSTIPSWLSSNPLIKLLVLSQHRLPAAFADFSTPYKLPRKLLLQRESFLWDRGHSRSAPSIYLCIYITLSSFQRSRETRKNTSAHVLIPAPLSPVETKVVYHSHSSRPQLKGFSPWSITKSGFSPGQSQRVGSDWLSVVPCIERS